MNYPSTPPIISNISYIQIDAMMKALGMLDNAVVEKQNSSEIHEHVETKVRIETCDIIFQ